MRPNSTQRYLRRRRRRRRQPRHPRRRTLTQRRRHKRLPRRREIPRILHRRPRRLIHKPRHPITPGIIRHILHRHGPRPRNLQHVRVVGVQRRRQRVLGLLLGLLGVRLVGVLALADGLEDAGGVPLCEFDLLQRLGVGLAPFAGEVEEGCCGVEGVCCLSLCPLAFIQEFGWRASPTSSPCSRATFAQRAQTSAAQTAQRTPARPCYQ